MGHQLPEQEQLSERLESVRGRIVTAAKRSGRSADEIKLVAISKTHPPATVEAGLAAGLTDFGENRVQEADEKIAAIGRTKARWHLVGHLQANKARRAIELFDCLHSLDSSELAQRLDRLCVDLGKAEFPVLVQVKLGGEPTKSGVDPGELPDLLNVLGSCQRVRLIGLMTLPPYFENPDCARPFFKTLRELRDELNLQGHFGEQPGELSMGMTHDFEIAIEEGSTMVRVGTAIFGARS